jgi:hypothetical protein
MLSARLLKGVMLALEHVLDRTLFPQTAHGSYYFILLLTPVSCDSEHVLFKISALESWAPRKTYTDLFDSGKNGKTCKGSVYGDCKCHFPLEIILAGRDVCDHYAQLRSG